MSLPVGIGQGRRGSDLPAWLGTRTARGRPWRRNSKAQLCGNGMRLKTTHSSMDTGKAQWLRNERKDRSRKAMFMQWGRKQLNVVDRGEMPRSHPKTRRQSKPGYVTGAPNFGQPSLSSGLINVLSTHAALEAPLCSDHPRCCITPHYSIPELLLVLAHQIGNISSREVPTVK